MCLQIFLLLGQCKAGRTSFGGRLGKVRPALRKAGRAFSLRGKFSYISPLFLCARAEISIEMALIWNSCDLPCARRVALFNIIYGKVATWQSGSEGSKKSIF